MKVLTESKMVQCPFSSGTDYADWVTNNCYKCALLTPSDDGPERNCIINNCIELARFSCDFWPGGKLTDDTGKCVYMKEVVK